MKKLTLLTASLASLAGGAALAHTELKATVPTDASVVAEAPENVELTFSEPVRLTALSIQKDGAQKQSLGPLPSATSATFSLALPDVEDGHYVVSWRALSEDTHVMSGDFMFAVGAAADHAHMNHEASGDGQSHPMPAGEHREDHGGAH